MTEEIQQRLEYLRGEIDAERISWGELSELQLLASHIDEGDVQLLEWAGVPEFPDDEPTVEQMEAFADPERRPRPVDTDRALDGGPRRWWHYR